MTINTQFPRVADIMLERTREMCETNLQNMEKPMERAIITYTDKWHMLLNGGTFQKWYTWGKWGRDEWKGLVMIP